MLTIVAHKTGETGLTPTKKTYFVWDMIDSLVGSGFGLRHSHDR